MLTNTKPVSVLWQHNAGLKLHSIHIFLLPSGQGGLKSTQKKTKWYI